MEALWKPLKHQLQLSINQTRALSLTISLIRSRTLAQCQGLTRTLGLTLFNPILSPNLTSWDDPIILILIILILTLALTLQHVGSMKGA